MDNPPSTGKLTPLIEAAMGEHKNATAAPTSSAVANLPVGIFVKI
jgi:hypothetical protein